MKYIVPEKDQDKVIFVNNLARLVLDKMKIKYTHPFLTESISKAYFDIFQSAPSSSDNPDEITVVDRDDPSNLAIVLLEAFKKYHIKNEITEHPISTDNLCSLVILKGGENKSYNDLVGILVAGKENEVHIINADKKKKKITGAGCIENYVTLKKSQFTGEPGYTMNHKRLLFKKMSFSAAILLLTMVIGIVVYHGIKNYKLELWIPELLILFAGGFISYNLHSIGNLNSSTGYLVKKFCITKEKGNSCQRVLQSPASKIFGIVSMTDAGLIYFGGLFAFTIMGLVTNSYGSYLSLLFWCAVIPLPYTLFSIYYQVKVVKKVCALCLLTQIVLWMHFGYLLFAGTGTDLFAIHWPSFIFLLVTMSVISILYFLFEQYNRLNRLSVKLLMENDKYKEDIDFFDLLINRQIRFKPPDLPGALLLGNQYSSTKLTAVLSLSCAPCRNMLKDLVRLSDWFEDGIDIKVFIAPGPNPNPLTDNLLNYTLSGNHYKAKLLLSEWYDFLVKEKVNPNKNGISITERWCKQNLIDVTNSETSKVASMHMQWFKEQFIPHTPLLIHGGHFLPNSFYDIDVLSTIIEKKMELESNGK